MCSTCPKKLGRKSLADEAKDLSVSGCVHYLYFSDNYGMTEGGSAHAITSLAKDRWRTAESKGAREA
jgi:hypothetical protein